MKPILFSTPMVQAILSGRKTQTRRPVNPQPVGGVKFCNLCDVKHPCGGWQDCHGRYLARQFHVGDILYVRETWGIGLQIAGSVIYKADYTDRTVPLADGEKWRPSIHMPREVARIFLRVTDVRAERLQEISEDDAMAEGVEPTTTPNIPGIGKTYIQGFGELWDTAYAKAGYRWNTNPLVFAYEFERVTNREDEK